MPPENGQGPDIDRLIERIRAEARERFPEDVQEEATLWRSAGAASHGGGREPLRARLKRHPLVGRVGRLIKGLLLAGRTRVRAEEANQAAQAGLRETAQLKARMSAVEAQAADIQPLSDRLAGVQDRVGTLEQSVTDRLAWVEDRAATLEQSVTDLDRTLRADVNAQVARAEEQAARAEEQAARAERGLRVARADLRAREVALDRLYAKLDGRDDVRTDPVSPAEADVSTAEMEAFFSAFDAGLRGSADEIASQLRPYLADLHAAGAGSDDRPVLDLGCGRGTWLQMLRDDGIVARGIDLNRALVAEGQASGLDVEVQDALAALRAQPEASLGAITAFHLAEHLPFETLYAVFAEARRTLAAGGLLLLETPNPENGYVGTHTFYHDPTHGNPLTPALMDFLAGYHGFADVEVRRVNPYPHAARLPDGVPANDRLNGWLCGEQDFALIARAPGESTTRAE